MFTGMVEELGAVLSRDGNRFRFRASKVLDEVAHGDSIAVNGCCLTVVESGDGWWEADVTGETLARTKLSSSTAGDPVNLERPVSLADRLGGHLVQGHVDGIGTISSPSPDLRVEVDHDLTRYLVEKGSVAVDGVSLTVVDVDHNSFSAAIIPHTADVTTLGSLAIGDPVNIEVDVTVKYVEKLLSWQLEKDRSEVSS
ncbi:MAG: riboflavin synthase [Actinomycetia bacterium]|nr:riboflavin synthase [Actinomycetes bacterium]MCP4957815.1 riboflavin synthase [Actinomycetes bacterium]